MADKQQQAAEEFAEYWEGKGYEKGQSQLFWISLLHDVYGIEHPEKFIEFEDQVHLDNTSFIDGMIPSTRVMIEQKSLGKALDKPIKQSDGSFLTPFQQAKHYILELPVDQHPRYVITCNFSEFWVYDMNKPGGDPEKILLKDLGTDYYRLQFMVESGNEHIKHEEEVSVQAGELVGLIYDAFAKQYKDPSSEHAMHSLNVLCVRLVFCLYAENGGIFGRYGLFHDYMETFPTHQMRQALISLFEILDTPVDQRDPYLEDDNPQLAEFPYVNGGLFSDENIEIPPFTDEIRNLLLEKASAGFNWSEISPTIFGAVFESTLNPETRRSGGMHYTSVENIHKVIDPLFLDDLKAEFDKICNIQVERTKKKKLEEFQQKLASLVFLDPACGSGNFLTETYLSLRRLENDVLRELMHGQMSFGLEGINPIQVSLDQFYGIEINDFAVTVAKTALWIAESQMMQETESIVLMDLDFLPLKSYTNIVEGNALRMNWADVVPKQKLNYIMGNPPFVGNVQMSDSQKNDMDLLFDKKEGRLDYVAAWYVKAAQLIQDTRIECSFVSTNSITQGVQVPTLWGYLENKYPIMINFAYQTFQWNNEAKDKAAVHCVIIGFANFSRSVKKLYYCGSDTMNVHTVDNISYYLTDGPSTIVYGRNEPLSDVPKMVRGNQASDGGWLILDSDEYKEFAEKEPQALPYIKKFMMGREFINNIDRYCLWLVGVSPKVIQSMPMVMERVKKCKEARLNAPAALTRSFAETPTLFGQRAADFDGNYIALGRVSSQNRRYVPMDFLTQDVIAGDKLYIIPGGTIYMFGILMSNVHNAWMRMFAGRMKSDYSYSIQMVYNTFPWPDSTDEQKTKIEQTAQWILDARALYPDSSLADLYDELTMPSELRKAHQLNDKAVMEAYGWTSKDEAFHSESACVAELMKMYQKLTS